MTKLQLRYLDASPAPSAASTASGQPVRMLARGTGFNTGRALEYLLLHGRRNSQAS